MSWPTDPERRLREVEQALIEETCICGAIPTLTYEPGVTEIRCPRCNIVASVADFEPEQCLSVWRAKTNP